MATEEHSLQDIYNELNRRGFYKSGEGQAIGHEFRRRGLVTDATQGGAVAPTPTAAPVRPTAPIQPVDPPTLQLPNVPAFRYPKTFTETEIEQTEQRQKALPQFAAAPGYHPAEGGDAERLRIRRQQALGRFAAREAPGQQESLNREYRRLQQQRDQIEGLRRTGKPVPPAMLNDYAARVRGLEQRQGEIETVTKRAHAEANQQFMDANGRVTRAMDRPLHGGVLYPGEAQQPSVGAEMVAPLSGRAKLGAAGAAAGLALGGVPGAFSGGLMGALTQTPDVIPFYNVMRARKQWSGEIPQLPTIPYKGPEGRQRGIAEKNRVLGLVNVLGDRLKDDGTISDPSIKYATPELRRAAAQAARLNPFEKSLIPVLRTIKRGEKSALEESRLMHALGMDVTMNAAFTLAGPAARAFSGLLGEPVRIAAKSAAPELYARWVAAGSPEVWQQAAPLSRQALGNLLLRNVPQHVVHAGAAGVIGSGLAAGETAAAGGKPKEIIEAGVEAFLPTVKFALAMGGMHEVMGRIPAVSRRNVATGLKSALARNGATTREGLDLEARLKQAGGASGAKAREIYEGIERDYGHYFKPPAAAQPAPGRDIYWKPGTKGVPRTPGKAPRVRGEVVPSVGAEPAPAPERITLPALQQRDQADVMRGQRAEDLQAAAARGDTDAQHWLDRHEAYQTQRNVSLDNPEHQRANASAWIDSEARRQYDALQAAAQANPRLADRLTEAANTVRQDWHHQWVRDNAADMTAEPVIGPPMRSVWRGLSPEEQRALPQPVRHALIVQDILNSRSVQDPASAAFFDTKGLAARGGKGLEALADREYEAAQQRAAQDVRTAQEARQAQQMPAAEMQEAPAATEAQPAPVVEPPAQAVELPAQVAEPSVQPPTPRETRVRGNTERQAVSEMVGAPIVNEVPAARRREIPDDLLRAAQTEVDKLAATSLRDTGNAAERLVYRQRLGRLLDQYAVEAGHVRRRNRAANPERVAALETQIRDLLKTNAADLAILPAERGAVDATLAEARGRAAVREGAKREVGPKQPTRAEQQATKREERGAKKEEATVEESGQRGGRTGEAYDEMADQREADRTAKQIAEQVNVPEKATAKPAAEVPAAETAAEIEQRTNKALRQAVEELTPEEKDQVIHDLRNRVLVDPATGLGTWADYLSRPAEGPLAHKAAQASIDVDGLGWVNTNFGHEGGDALITKVGEIMRELGLEGDVWHKSGDEFAAQADTPANLERLMVAARERLENTVVEFTKEDGTVHAFTGIRLTHVTDKTYKLADKRLEGVKEAARAAGLRAPKGERPPGLVEVGGNGRGVEGEQGGDQGPAGGVAGSVEEASRAEVGAKAEGVDTTGGEVRQQPQEQQRAGWTRDVIAAGNAKYNDALRPEAERLFREGKTQPQIAAQLGVALSRVARILATTTPEAGYSSIQSEVQNKIAERKKAADPLRARIQEMLERGGKTLQAIAEEVGVPKSRVQSIAVDLRRPPLGERQSQPQEQQRAGGGVQREWESNNPKFNDFMRETEQPPRESWLTRKKETARAVGHAITRAYEHLPEGAEFATVKKALDEMKAGVDIAEGVAFTKQKAWYRGLSNPEFQVLRYVTRARDLKEEIGKQQAAFVEAGGDAADFKPRVPRQMTEKDADQVLAEMAPKLTPKIEAAIQRRKDDIKTVMDTFFAARKEITGQEPTELDREEWFHHMVVDYVNDRARGSGGRVGRVPGTPGSLKERTGSESDYVTGVEAENDWLPAIIRQTELYRFLKLVEDQHDISRSLHWNAMVANDPTMDTAWSNLAAGKGDVQALVDGKLAQLAWEGALPDTMGGRWNPLIQSLAIRHEMKLRAEQGAEVEAIGKGAAMGAMAASKEGRAVYQESAQKIAADLKEQTKQRVQAIRTATGAKLKQMKDPAAKETLKKDARAQIHAELRQAATATREAYRRARSESAVERDALLRDAERFTETEAARLKREGGRSAVKFRGAADVRAERRKGATTPLAAGDQAALTEYAKWLLTPRDVPGMAGPSGVSAKRALALKAALGKDVIRPEDILKLPEYKRYGQAWNPKRGSTWEISHTSQFVDEGLKQLGETLKVDLSAARSALQRGVVIPEELTQTLDALGTRKGDGFADRAERTLRRGMGVWKWFRIIHPQQAAGYWTNNLRSGVNALIYNPKALSWFSVAPKEGGGWRLAEGIATRAERELGSLLTHGEVGSPEFEGWLKRGGMAQMLETKETGQSLGFSSLKGYREKGGKRAVLAHGVEAALKFPHIYREGVERYSSYLAFLERFRKGWEPEQGSYLASNRAEVMALKTPEDKAWRMAQDLSVDYGRVPEAAQFVANHVAPFFRYPAGNAIRQGRLFTNEVVEPVARAIRQGNYGAVGPVLARQMARFALSALALEATAQAWNMLPRNAELEEKLSEDQRRRPHLVLWSDADGKTVSINMTGNLVEALGWVGLDNTMGYMSAYLEGRMEMPEILQEMAKGVVNRAVGQVGPQFKTPAELVFGKRFGPDVFKPGNIHDRTEYAFEQANLGPLYRWYSGRPQKEGFWQRTLTTTRTEDPGQAAYFDMKDEVGRFLAKENPNKVRGNTQSGGTPRANAAYLWREAERAGEDETAKRRLYEFGMEGGRPQTLATSLLNSEPLHSLNGAEEAKILQALTPTQKEAMKRAYLHWQKQVAPGSDVSTERGLGEFVIETRRNVRKWLGRNNPLREMMRESPTLSREMREQDRERRRAAVKR